MAYIGNNLDSDIQVNKYQYTATSGQTDFACTYDRAVDVYLNGIKLAKEDFTATDGTKVTLVSGANTGDIVDINAYFDITYYNIDNELPTQTGNAGKFLTTDGTNSSWAEIVVDDEVAIGSTPPSNPAQGQVWYDTNLDILKAYDGTNWNKVSPVIPTIASIAGTIYESIGGNITITGTGFLSDECSVEFSGSFTTTSVNATASSDTTLVVAVPAAAYASTGTVNIKITNSDNGQSPSSTFSVLAIPTGGTITTSGSYRIHTFTTSSSFVVPSGTSLSNVEYLVIAGGGSGSNSENYGGSGAGGGGAGGYRCSVSSESSGGGSSAESKLSLSSGSYTVTVGAGAANQYTHSNGYKGSSSSFSAITSIGGGGGVLASTTSETSGGSGGGGGESGGAIAPGSGTSGQGYRGGYSNNTGGGGGGGGAGSVGGDTTGSSAGNGGSGVQSSINGSATYRAGGGGGAADTGSSAGAGGIGGGGSGTSPSGNVGGNGAVNTGSGGGATGYVDNGTSGAGGSGIVIVRYQL
jgi:hypothetical protein